MIGVVGGCNKGQWRRSRAEFMKSCEVVKILHVCRYLPRSMDEPTPAQFCIFLQSLDGLSDKAM